MNRNDAARLGAETVTLTRQGWYESRPGHRVSIADAVALAVHGTELIRPTDWRSIHRRAAEAAGSGADRPAVEVTDETTLAAARRLLADGAGDVLALNFASAKNPGGGFLGGSRAQEESLARSSALHECLLAQPAYYDANRGGPRALYTDHAIYSPRVPVFRADDGALLDEPYELSFLTMPAPNVRAMRERGGAPDDGMVADTMARRIGHVLAFAAARGYRTLVLGAWGCGAFGNDPEVVARLFAEALAGPVARAFDRVTFAVFDRLDGQPVLAAFRRHVG